MRPEPLWKRALWLAAALLVALPAAAAQPALSVPPAPGAPDGPAAPSLDALVAAFMDRPDGPLAVRSVVPPESIYRGMAPVCDLDGDGLPDLVTNDLQLRRPGHFDGGASTVRALSSATGQTLWSQDNLRYSTLEAAHGFSSARPGQPNPQSPPNVLPTVDVNGDGVCDVLAFGYQRSVDDISAPLISPPSVTYIDVTVQMLDGRNGTTLWQTQVRSTTVDVSDPFLSIEEGNAVLGFPTGLALAQGKDGPRYLLKTTDLVYGHAQDIVGLTSPLFGGKPFYAAAASTGEHLLEADARTGETLWTRDFPVNPNADRTNITWISGFGDLSGDGEPDIVLDQFTMANPRGREAQNPLAPDQPLYRNGRGMRMLALDGAKQGEPLWSTVLLDPLAVQTPPPNEESLEILAWTFGTVLPDVTGDGRPDPVGQYLTEEMVGGTPNGKHRTHFVPLDGATGHPLWDRAQQGWGFLTRLGSGPRGAVLGAATLDLPEATAVGAHFPSKSVRISGLDAGDGTPLWSFEAPFAQDSQASYEIGLHQVRSALAPLDVDGDGVLDPVTPAQSTAPAGREQVFLATARQHFQVLSGSSGRRLLDLDSWGSNGLLLPCGSGRELTFVVGHAKRLDLERFGLANGTLLWRRPVWSFLEPRSSTVGMDLLALDGTCRDLDGGRTVYGANLEAYSVYRGYEIVPLLGLLRGNGTAAWQVPDVDPGTPTPSLLEGLSRPAARFLPAGLPTALAAAALGVAGIGLGALASIPAGRAALRRRRRLDPLGIALMLLVLPGAALPGPHADSAHAALAPADPPSWAAQAPGPAAAALLASATPHGALSLPVGGRMAAFLAATRDLHGPGSAERLVQAAQAYAGRGPDVSDRFDENATLSYPATLGDEDGDGVDDIALDLYCVSDFSCYDPVNVLLNDPAGLAHELLRPSVCGPRHQLVVLSGATGGRLWDAPLDTPHPLSRVSLGSACAIEAMLGTVPLDGGETGILVYRLEASNLPLSPVTTLNHTLYLLDGATGAVRWRFSEAGVLASSIFQPGPNVGRSVLLNPILVQGEPGRTPDRTAGAGPGLFVQGIGYSYNDASTLLPPPGLNDAARVSDDYQPIEWLARLDPRTGQVLWRNDASFQPQAGRSVLPLSQMDGIDRYRPDGYTSYQPDLFPAIPPQVVEQHWADAACCGDLTGDGVADPVFTTVEWNPLSNAKAQGPYRFDARAVAFDGASGSLLWNPLVVRDLPGQSQQTPYWQYPFDSFRLTTQAVGDASGDGAADVLLNQVDYTSDYHWASRLLDGRTGATLWTLEAPRAQGTLVLGDADGDRGNDILFFDWFDLENLRPIRGGYSNVTATPLTLHSGHDGSILYRASTVSAPVDLVYLFRTADLNGPPDLDGDGVGDFPTDDPVYLPDQVTLHQVTYLSGRTAKPILTIPATGAFAYPARMPDLTGDGRGDLAVLSGDANDLWISYHDGQDGRPLWSHRAVAPKSSSYAYAVPRLQVLPLRTGPGPGDTGFLLNLHMDVQTVVGELTFIYLDVGGSDSGTQRLLLVDEHTVPQLDVVLDPLGHRTWSYPVGGDPADSRVEGATPGTAALATLRERAEPTLLFSAGQLVAEAWIPGVALLAGFAVALLAGIRLQVRRARA